MKIIIVLATLVAAAIAIPGNTYDSKYDNFDGQELVDNERLLKSYAKCFVGQGHCTPEGADFKKVIPEALRTKCAKCTPKQRQLVRLVARGLQTKQPELWSQLVKQEDPTGKFKKEFNDFLNASD